MKNEMNTGNFRVIPLAEQQEINGGAVPFFILIGVAAVTQIITDWDNFKNGLMGRPEVKNVPTTVNVEQ
ncbi:MAG: hypothetical protein V2B15_03195 [Bacteroidota bacterium]